MFEMRCAKLLTRNNSVSVKIGALIIDVLFSHLSRRSVLAAPAATNLHHHEAALKTKILGIINFFLFGASLAAAELRSPNFLEPNFVHSSVFGSAL